MRQDRSAKVTVYTKGKDISYAGCGLPYYVGGSIENREENNLPYKYSGKKKRIMNFRLKKRMSNATLKINKSVTL